MSDSPQNHSRARPRSSLRGVIVVGILAIVAGVIFAVDRFSSSSDATDAMTHRVERGEVVVSIVEQGTLESSSNTEIKCKVRGWSTVTWVIPSGSVVESGQELVRLDTKVIEETVSLTKTNVDLARAKLERSSADLARSEIAVDAYLKGQYKSQMKSLEKDLTIAEANLLAAQKMLGQSRSLFKRGYVTDLEVDGHEFTVERANLELKVKKTEIDVLERFTKKMRIEALEGAVRALTSKKAADTAELEMTKKQRRRALEELEACVVKAERDGLVIYPSNAKWKDTPDITEGASVRKDQVLLLMPDLSRMQVQVGVHESVVERVKAGLDVRVTLPDRTLEAKVSRVSTVASPTGWWTGNVVTYDTIIELPSVEGLKPGMSAQVEIILESHQDVISVPVAAVIESEGQSFVWVKAGDEVERRLVELGDTNDVFVVVERGLAVGEEVALNPLAYAEEAIDEGVGASGLVNPEKSDVE